MRRVNAEIEHAIIRHTLVDGWPVGTVARELKVHHGVVRRVLRQHGQAPQPHHIRRRKIDPFTAFIDKTLQDYPKLHASRLFQMVRERGYDGSESHFRRLIAEIRPRPAPEPFARLDMPPGEQAQVDWGHFGTVEVGRAVRPLYAFVMTLSWSRMVWLQFFHDMQMASFLAGHIGAFTFFAGVPRSLLYDNLKSVVTERYGRSIRFNEQLLQFASHYGFEPRAANPARGNEKGRVERAIRYIRTSFFAARRFVDIADLNTQAILWTNDIGGQRRWPEDDRKLVVEQFTQEQARLRALPPTPFEAAQRVQAKVGRTPYVRFDTNDYSVPAKYVRREVTILAEPVRVRIVVDGEVVAEHARTYDRKATMSQREHLQGVIEYKRRARKNAGTYRLTKSAPAAALMIERAAQRGHNLGSLVSHLLDLLDTYGGVALENALTEVNGKGRVGFKPVRLVIEKQARAELPEPLLPVRIQSEALRSIFVESPDLSTYDDLNAEPKGDDDDQDT